MLRIPPTLPVVLLLVLTGPAQAAPEAAHLPADARLDAPAPPPESAGPNPGQIPHGAPSPAPLPVTRVSRSHWGGYLGALEEQVRVAIARVARENEQGPAGGGLEPLGPPGPPSEIDPDGVDVQTDVDVSGEPPLRLHFAPVSPNPSPGGLTLRFALPRPATVRFSVLDVAGRMVRDLSRRWEAGRHTLDWNLGARNTPPGVYFVRMDVEGKPVGTQRLILLF